MHTQRLSPLSTRRFHPATIVAFVLSVILVMVHYIAMPPIAEGVSGSIVVSQIYGGGGNSGATFKNDFIELYNLGNSTVNVTGWSVQYASATGTTWQVTGLSGSIAPGKYYLVQEAQGAGGTTILPTPDATGAIAMSATAGKVALVNSSTALSGSCPSSSSIIDFVGFGSTASCFEGSGPTPAPSNTTAVLRSTTGCTETDNNSSDFTAGSPNPRNSATAARFCTGPTNPSGTGSATPSSVAIGGSTLLTVVVTAGTSPPSTGITVTGNLSPIGGSATQQFFDDATHGDVTPSDNTFSFQATVASGTTAGSKNLAMSIADAQSRTGSTTLTLTVQPPIIAIHDIQGSGLTSPHVGELVATNGIVTARRSNGFFIQTPDAVVDAETNTSEGIFVFTSSTPPSSAALGNAVTVTGTVQEFIPSADPFSPPFTEIAGSPSVTVVSTGNPLPVPITLNSAQTSPTGSVEQLERFEGMRVHVSSLTVISPTQGSINEPNATSTTNGVFYGVITGVQRPFREPGIIVGDPLPPGSPCCVPRFDGNPERLRVDSDAQIGAAALEVTAGATVTNLTGPLDFAFRTYTILPDAATPPTVTGNISAAPLPVKAPDEFTVGSFNMERFFDSVNDPNITEPVLTPTAFNNRLNKASLAIRGVMRSPDILGVEEVENLTTLQAVATKLNNDAITAGQPNPNYQSYLVEGNDIGGIDVGFLVKSSIVTVLYVTQVGKESTFINPNTGLSDLLNDRPPLVLRAIVQLQVGSVFPVTVIVNHLRSLTDIDDPLDGPRVRAKRRAQAEFLATLIQTRQTADPDEHIIAVGDFNAFQFNDGYADLIGTIKGTPTPSNMVVLASSDLVNPDIVDLVEQAPADQRYSFYFDGSAQILDHVLVAQNVLPRVSGFRYARVDADFPESYRNDALRPERVSDHDVPVAYFKFPLQCPLGQGFWKNHPEVWAVHSLHLGNVSYSDAQLLDILKTPIGVGKKGDASLILAHKLVIAKLNVAMGASPCGTAIADADALIGNNSIPMSVLPSTPVGKQMTALAEKLDSCANAPCTLASTTPSPAKAAVPDRTPGAFELGQNFPNPFNPSTAINFTVTQNGFASLKVYSVLGQEVAILFEANAEAGRVYTVNFDASSLPSGMYFYRLRSGGKVESKRMMVLK